MSITRVNAAHPTTSHQPPPAEGELDKAGKTL